MQDKNAGGNTLGCVQTGPRRANAVCFTQRSWMSLQWEQSQPARDPPHSSHYPAPLTGWAGRLWLRHAPELQEEDEEEEEALWAHEMLQVQLRLPHSSPRKLKFTSHRMWVPMSRKGGVGSLLQGRGQWVILCTKWSPYSSSLGPEPMKGRQAPMTAVS